MTETGERPDPRLEALQAVYDRVQSYEESATTEQIRSELDQALDKAGLDVTDETRQRLTDHIHGGGGHQDVADLLA